MVQEAVRVGPEYELMLVIKRERFEQGEIGWIEARLIDRYVARVTVSTCRRLRKAGRVKKLESCPGESRLRVAGFNSVIPMLGAGIGHVIGPYRNGLARGELLNEGQLPPTQDLSVQRAASSEETPARPKGQVIYSGQ